jgi:hypothetical protein
MTSPKFKVGERISWESRKWHIKDVDSEHNLYELTLVDKQDGMSVNGTGGHGDISNIDKTATLDPPKTGGLKRSLKNRRSLNRRRNYRRRVKTIRRK